MLNICSTSESAGMKYVPTDQNLSLISAPFWLMCMHPDVLMSRCTTPHPLSLLLYRRDSTEGFPRWSVRKSNYLLLQASFPVCLVNQSCCLLSPESDLTWINIQLVFFFSECIKLSILYLYNSMQFLINTKSVWAMSPQTWIKLVNNIIYPPILCICVFVHNYTPWGKNCKHISISLFCGCPSWSSMNFSTYSMFLPPLILGLFFIASQK